MKRMFLYNALLIGCGIVFGVLAYFCLPDSQALAVQNFWFQSIQNIAGQMLKDTVILQIFQQKFAELLRIYFFGLCLLGVPLLFIVVFIQGFSLGFLFCFLGGQSVLLAILQMCYIPIYLSGTTLAVSFAQILQRNQMDNPWRQIIKYTFYFIFLMVATFLLSCLDGLISIYILQKMI